MKLKALIFGELLVGVNPLSTEYTSLLDRYHLYLTVISYIILDIQDVQREGVPGSVLRKIEGIFPFPARFPIEGSVYLERRVRRAKVPRSATMIFVVTPFEGGW